MNVLVGYTGFVGSNIYKHGNFDKVFNSKNIEEAYGINPDLLIYAGLPAEKYLANNFPDKDLAIIKQAKDNIKQINPKQLVLISTIDVFSDPNNVDETTPINTSKLGAYGYNRYQLELWVRRKYPEALIIRLPALFGDNLKKNFIYDYINVIPFMLTSKKFKELSNKDSELTKYYKIQDNGFYKLNLHEQDKEILKEKFNKLGFSAIQFTDSRNLYQFYNLQNLWKDIQKALRLNIRLWHPATEPISVYELYKFLEGKSFSNNILETPLSYNFKTLYDKEFGGERGYIFTKEEMLKQIKEFIDTETQD